MPVFCNVQRAVLISLNELKVEKGEPTNLPDSSQISLQEEFKMYDVFV